MVRVEVLRRRLGRLDECLGILRRLQRYGVDEFLADPERYGSAERFLQLAIEAVTDMGSHLIADLALGEVKWYSDIPRILAEKGYIGSSTRLGFRRAQPIARRAE